jgi:hypothetical protein
MKLIDTDILIDHFHGNQSAREICSQYIRPALQATVFPDQGHRDPHAPNTSPPSHDMGIKGNAIKSVHLHPRFQSIRPSQNNIVSRKGLPFHNKKRLPQRTDVLGRGERI